MNKKAFLSGAMIVSSLLPLSSCESEKYEITRVHTFPEAYDLFENFFAKTFEHNNMKVTIKRSEGFLADAETNRWDKKESEEVEVIFGESSHRYNKDRSKETWAFVDGENRVAATEITNKNEDGSTSKERTYCLGETEYQNSYKSYIKQINFFEKIATESFLTGKTPEEVGGFDSVEFTFHDKYTNYHDGENFHWESYSCLLRSYEDEEDSSSHTIYMLDAFFGGYDGLVSSCYFSHNNYENGSLYGYEELTLEFRYNSVEKIDLPDVSTWESKNE